jgi:hypothetical protein
MTNRTAARHRRPLQDLLERPILWGCLYLALIPIFGLVYDMQIDGFYQTSGVHEAAVVDSDGAVEYAVADAVNRAVQYQANKTSRTRHESVFPHPLYLTASSTDLIVTLGFPFAADDEKYIQVDISTNATDVTTNFTDPLAITYTLRSPVAAGESQTLALFLDYSGSTNPPVLNFTQGEYDLLHRVASIERGSLQGLPGQYARMCYFSTITITTLGYGDIGPITANSRAEVMTEAILGVVFAGLFLNAVGRRRNARDTLALSSSSDCQSCQAQRPPRDATDHRVQPKDHLRHR